MATVGVKGSMTCLIYHTDNISQLPSGRHLLVSIVATFISVCT